MDQVFRYRVKGKASRRKLDAMARAVSFVWNFCGDTQRAALRWGRKWPTGYDFNALTNGCGNDLGISAQTIQAVGQQYAQSRQQHKKRLLRFRGKRSLGWVPFKGGVRVSGHGFKHMGHQFNVWLSRPVPGAIKCGSFSQDARGHWYINVCVDVIYAWVCPDKKVGIDLGLKTTATMSDGQKYDGLRAYRAVEESLGKAQRAHKKKRVKALHAKAKNRRLDGLHKLSTQLVRDNQMVVVGDVSSKNLGKTKMAKSVYDAGWGLLKNMLRYKSIAKGVTYREVNEAYSSQLCSACGSLPGSRPRGIAQLGIREWVCSNCGQGHDRDINAARNILALGCERPVEGILAL
jgi:putative transposase